MRFMTLATVFCVIIVLATLFSQEAESSHVRKLRLVKKLAKMFLKGKHGKVLLALPFPLPIPLPLPLPLPVVKKIPLPTFMPSTSILQSLLPALSALNLNSWPSAAAGGWSSAGANIDSNAWSAPAPISYDSWSAPISAPSWPIAAPSISASAWPAASSSAAISADSGYQSGSGYQSSQANYQEPSKTASYPAAEQSWSSGGSSVQQEVVEQKQTSSGGY